MLSAEDLAITPNHQQFVYEHSGQDLKGQIQACPFFRVVHKHKSSQSRVVRTGPL
jgi:hypothetical protein